MTIIKDINGNKLISIPEPVNEDFVVIVGKKVKVVSKETKDGDTVVTVDTSLLLED